MLGGRIGAYSCPGLGSTFWFTIPLELPPPLAAAAEPAGGALQDGRGERGASGTAASDGNLAVASSGAVAVTPSSDDSEQTHLSLGPESHLVVGDAHILCTVKEAYEGGDGPQMGVGSEAACPLFRLDDHQLGSWSSSELSGGIPAIAATASDNNGAAAAVAASEASSRVVDDAQVQLIALLGGGRAPQLPQPGRMGSDAAAAGNAPMMQSRMSVSSTRPSMEQRGRTSLEQSSELGFSQGSGRSLHSSICMCFRGSDFVLKGICLDWHNAKVLVPPLPPPAS